jgi:beta-galactosidase/beta-glucuronidase
MNSEPKLRKILILLCLAVFGVAGNAFSQDLSGNRENYKLVGWKFYKGDILSAESGDKISEKGWQEVNIPHTWNAEDVLTEGDHCYQGIGWYRSSFDLPKEQRSKRYFIRFEGACLVADIYVNGIYIGRHKGGYSAFCYEITRQDKKTVSLSRWIIRCRRM